MPPALWRRGTKGATTRPGRCHAAVRGAYGGWRRLRRCVAPTSGRLLTGRGAHRSRRRLMRHLARETASCACGRHSPTAVSCACDCDTRLRCVASAAVPTAHRGVEVSRWCARGRARGSPVARTSAYGAVPSAPARCRAVPRCRGAARHRRTHARTSPCQAARRKGRRRTEVRLADEWRGRPPEGSQAAGAGTRARGGPAQAIGFRHDQPAAQPAPSARAAG
ncbi:hypothetical protein EDD27_9002 [Nonomuraea polychroma]|uniref:Uncharacterized protein n=1 Tax=Nonomuraea polychroma TaxID=46176 RepID=A0A438MJQ4_9ACTN|nr:hypothetical protein EDD27_9002 [Nonomuraea polychroma]